MEASKRTTKPVGNKNMRLENYLLGEQEKLDVINRIYKIADSWGISLHGMESIPVHFGLNRFYEIGETEFLIVNDKINNYCGKFLFLFKGQTCPTHYHKNKHETFFIIKGRIRMVVNEDEKVLKQGNILAVAQGHAHSFSGLTDALLLEVSNASTPKDSFFQNKHLGEKGVM